MSGLGPAILRSAGIQKSNLTSRTSLGSSPRANNFETHHGTGLPTPIYFLSRRSECGSQPQSVVGQFPAYLKGNNPLLGDFVSGASVWPQTNPILPYASFV